MVEGFRKTFTAWLDQRLVAEVYFEAVSNPEARRIEAWLEKRPEVTAILPVWKTKIRLASWPVDVVGLRPDETYRVHFPMLSATEDAWDSVRRGGAVLVSEQLARRLNLELEPRWTFRLRGQLARRGRRHLSRLRQSERAAAGGPSFAGSALARCAAHEL